MAEEKTLIGFYHLTNEVSRLESLLQVPDVQIRMLEKLAKEVPVSDRILIIIEGQNFIRFFGYTHDTANNGPFEYLRSRKPDLPARVQLTLGTPEEVVSRQISDYATSLKWDELSVLYFGKSAREVKARLKNDFDVEASDFYSYLRELSVREDQSAPILASEDGEYVHLDFLANLTGMGYDRCRELAIYAGIAVKVKIDGEKRHPLKAAARELDMAFDGYEWRNGRFIEKSTGLEVVTRETIDDELGVRSFGDGVRAGKLTELRISQNSKFPLQGCYKDQYESYRKEIKEN
ncbi:hypothetical protein J4206_04490 [Candidatus Woesearchaeota archaeon]|nr:hypothetical protein [Candidatus Woesearchaeota archaeon]